jgi:hypothetical protein
VAQVDGAVSGDFVQQLERTLAVVQSISHGIPSDRSGVVKTLVDQLLGIAGSFEGPEAETIRAWLQSIEELRDVLLPLIDEATASGDPAGVAIQVMEHALDSTLDVLGFGAAKSLVHFLETFPSGALPQDSLAAVAPALSAATSAYTANIAAAPGAYEAFRDSIAATAAALADVQAALRPVLGAVRRVSETKIFQPHALETFLREQMDQALGVQVHEVQKIDDPFKALFDRIDEAIAGIDLSAVRTDVLGFFQETRSTIEHADIGSVADTLHGPIAAVDGAVQELQQGVTELGDDLREFFDGLEQKLRELAGHVGTFAADGSFSFAFESDLHAALSQAHIAIAGDPDNPSAPSVAGTLNKFKTGIEGFVSDLNDALGPLEAQVAQASADAVAGINDFVAFLDGLDVPALLTELGDKVKEIVDKLADVDFDVVVDPVVSEIADTADKLRGIDTSSLNDLLRSALKTALEVVISIDFTAEISKPLREEYAKVRKLPDDAIDALQHQYELALAALEALKPEQLLDALFSAFDTIDHAIASLDVATLLAPLDALHKQHLVDPLAALEPSTLLRPAIDGFHHLTSGFDEIQGAELIAPLEHALDDVKQRVAAFDVAAPLDELLAAVEKVKTDLHDIRPSDLLQPLVDGFAQLESELDRFKPSEVFKPATELAGPLLAQLEHVEQEAVDALFQAFQAPLRVLDKLHPEHLTQQIQHDLDTVIAAVRTLDVPARYNALKGAYTDLKHAAEGDPLRASLVELVDPARYLGEIVPVYTELLAALEALKQNVELPDLHALYDELKQRLLDLLPPYAREALDPEAFKRLMRLADPTRFVQELDERFETLKNKLIPIRPQEIAAELDADYQAVLGLVEHLDPTESLNEVKATLERLKEIVASVRIDFIADDVDAAVRDVRAVVEALDPARFAAELDGLHADVEAAVASTKPSALLADLATTLNGIKTLLTSINPRTTLGPPLHQAWQAIEDVLEQVDFHVVLKPLVDKLDELERAFEAALQKTEDAFDGMLRAGDAALGGGAPAGAAGGGAPRWPAGRIRSTSRSRRSTRCRRSSSRSRARRCSARTAAGCGTPTCRRARRRPTRAARPPSRSRTTPARNRSSTRSSRSRSRRRSGRCRPAWRRSAS